ncbi:DUF4232 domain-containing protein [Streptomyces sp. NPDC089799]|uniref:DUF4232 domain-containing protein n=1 Tax=Streptomyces sp. NPDC089799 TaxID=3155066 RepID=UPI003429B6F5
MSNVLTRAAAVAAAALLAITGASVGATQASAQQHKATPACRLADLDLAIGQPDGEGSLIYPILFTNTTSHTCTLRGYPGVSVLDSRHRQIGTSAIRTGERVNTVSIAPDNTVTALIHTNTPDVVETNCRPTSTYVKVFPPNSFQAEQIRFRLQVCGQFEISPVEASY